MQIERIVNNYVNEFNEKLDINLKPIIKEDSCYRYPVYCNCAENTIIVWEELFEALTEEQKYKHVLYALAILYTAEFYGKETMIDGHKVRELPFNPNIIAEEVFKKVGLSFSPFEELQKEIYETKQKLYPYPDSRGSFFRNGDVLCRKGISRLVVKNIFAEDGVVMVQAQSVNSIDNTSITKTITCPEVEMLSMYRIGEAVEFKNN